MSTEQMANDLVNDHTIGYADDVRKVKKFNNNEVMFSFLIYKLDKK